MHKPVTFKLTLLLVCLLAIVSTHADNDQTLMVYGDSLSAAYGIQESDGWVNLLSHKLTSENYPVQVVNASVSGETTTGGLSRLPSMLATYTPDVFILELGGNDGLRGIPLSNIRENLAEMVQLAQQSGAQVILAGIQIPPNYGPRYTEPFFQQFAEIAEEFDLPLVPFLIDGIPQQPGLMQNDGIHPVAEAQGMILDNVWPVLQPVLKK
jgi:acyl-CoA thioesterase-1